WTHETSMCFRCTGRVRSSPIPCRHASSRPVMCCCVLARSPRCATLYLKNRGNVVSRSPWCSYKANYPRSPAPPPHNEPEAFEGAPLGACIRPEICKRPSSFSLLAGRRGLISSAEVLLKGLACSPSHLACVVHGGWRPGRWYGGFFVVSLQPLSWGVAPHPLFQQR